MGSQISENWLHDYEYVSKNNDGITLLRHKQRNQICQLIVVYVSDQQGKDKIMEQAKRRLEKGLSYIQSIEKIYFKEENAMCSNSDRFQMIFEESTPTLGDHLKYRRVKMSKFERQQVMYVIKSVASGLKQLKDIGEQHGKVNFHNIIVSSKVKLKDPIFVDQAKVEYNGRIRGFPSPEKLHEYYDVLTNFEQLYADLFSLGVVALQMLFPQTNMQTLYSNKNPIYYNNHINFGLLNVFLSRISDQKLKRWVSTLLSFQEKSRSNIYQQIEHQRIEFRNLLFLRQNPFKIRPQQQLLEPIKPCDYSQEPIKHQLDNRPLAIQPITNQAGYLQALYSPNPIINPSLTYQGSFNHALSSNYSPNDSKSTLTNSNNLHNKVSFGIKPVNGSKSAQFHQIESNSIENKQKNYDSKMPQKLEMVQFSNDYSSISQNLNRLSQSLKRLIQSQQSQRKHQFSQQNAVQNTSKQVSSLVTTQNEQVQVQNQSTLQKNPSLMKRARSIYTENITTTIPEVEQNSNISQDGQYVVEQYQIGTKYEGFKKNGKRNGIGKLFYSGGTYYDGEWKNNKMNGFGILTYPNGSVAYEGYWLDDEFDGKGVVYNESPIPVQNNFDYTDFSNVDDYWIMYEGEMSQGEKEGLGKLTLINGEYYEGQFSQNMVHGEGIFTRTNGSKIKGLWVESMLHKVYSD